MIHITDIHTHKNNCSGAIINTSIKDFSPQSGMFYSLGIHPWDINKTHLENDLQLIENIIINNSQILAIGECGLDAGIDIPLDKQLYILEQQIILSERLHKPLILHCVRRSGEIIKLYKKYKPKMAWIMHGFRSNENVANEIISKSNIYLSIGEKFNNKSLEIIPDNRILIETDESNIGIDKICSIVASVRSQSTEVLFKNIKHNIINIFSEY